MTPRWWSRAEQSHWLGCSQHKLTGINGAIEWPEWDLNCGAREGCVNGWTATAEWCDRCRPSRERKKSQKLSSKCEVISLIPAKARSPVTVLSRLNTLLALTHVRCEEVSPAFLYLSPLPLHPSHLLTAVAAAVKSLGLTDLTFIVFPLCQIKFPHLTGA